MKYRPTSVFNTPAKLLIPEVGKKNGVKYKNFIEDSIFYISFKSYGGTEKVINDVVVIEDTASVECYYNPKIKSDCKIQLLDDSSTWEIISPPENIERRNLYLKFKVRRTAGGA